MPDWSLVYIILLSTGLIFAIGCIVGVLVGKLHPAFFIPYGMALLAGPLWGFWQHLARKTQVSTSSVEELEPATGDYPEDDRVLVQTNEENTYSLEETGSDSPIFLDECNTILRDIKRGGVVRLKVKVVTVVAFIKVGWKLNFSSSDMINKIVLDDGLHTEVKRGLWNKVTDGLVQAHLIVKEPRKAIVPQHSLRGLLTYVVPDPTPANWRGFNR